jgi:hypothetical protein
MESSEIHGDAVQYPMTAPDRSTSENAAAGQPVVTWLRLEGLAVVAVSAALYAHTGASWWLFAALWLVPDLSMLGYLANSRLGAVCYNAVHTYLAPLMLAAIAILLHKNTLLPYAFLWCNHIGVDRSLGYGLKYPAGFGFTHLSRLGKHSQSTQRARLP